jgi:hypothetical protein
MIRVTSRKESRMLTLRSIRPLIVILLFAGGCGMKQQPVTQYEFAGKAWEAIEPVGLVDGFDLLRITELYSNAQQEHQYLARLEWLIDNPEEFQLIECRLRGDRFIADGVNYIALRNGNEEWLEYENGELLGGGELRRARVKPRGENPLKQLPPAAR